MQLRYDSLLTTTQVASMLGINPGHLRNTRAQGKLDLPFIRVGRAIRYRPSDVEVFIEANRKEVSK